jgi:hypothetical protein
MGLVDLVEKLINERGSAAVMEKRLVLIKEEAEVLDKKNRALTWENARLGEENAALKAKLATLSKAEEFEEHEGAAFKRKPGGGFHHGIYCPIHHLPASSIENGFPYSCPRQDCGWASHMTPRTLPSVIHKITPGSLSGLLGLPTE